jgi:hypothetical protein
MVRSRTRNLYLVQTQVIFAISVAWYLYVREKAWRGDVQLDLVLENELYDLNRAYRASRDQRDRRRIGARMAALHRELVNRSAARSGE